MNNKILIVIEKVFAFIFIALIILFLIPTSINLVELIKDPSTTIYANRFDINNPKAVNEQIIRVAIDIGFFFIVMLLSLWRLIKPNKILRIIIDVLYVFIIIFLTVGFIYAHLWGLL